MVIGKGMAPVRSHVRLIDGDSIGWQKPNSSWHKVPEDSAGLRDFFRAFLEWRSTRSSVGRWTLNGFKMSKVEPDC